MDGPAFIDFRDGKEPGAFRTIGEVGKALGIRQHVLRYWEEQFPMLRPLTRAGGRRYYRPEDVALIARIDWLVHAQGYTIRGARQALEGDLRDGPAVAETFPLQLAPESASGKVPLSPAGPTAAGLARDDSAADDHLADGDLVGAVRLLRVHLQTIHDHLAAALSAA